MDAKWSNRWVEVTREDCEETGRTLYAAVEVGCLEVAGVHYQARRSIRGCFERKSEALRVAGLHARLHGLQITDRETEDRYEVEPWAVLN